MPPLRVATDFTGIDAPIEALKQLKIPYEYMFASEIDKDCIDLLKSAKNGPRTLFGDVQKRTARQLAEFKGKIDLYVAGFPCQTYSTLRTKKTLKQKRQLFKACVQVIEQTKPSMFVLENIVKFKSHPDFQTLMNRLQAMGCYEIHANIFNSMHYGSPQSRERLYVVGLRLDSFTNPERFSPKKTRMRDIHKLIHPKRKSKQRPTSIPELRDYKGRKRGFTKTHFLSTYGVEKNTYANYVPCITTMCSSNLYVLHQKRWLDPDEALKIQGFRHVSFDHLGLRKQGVLVGNTMTVDVLKQIFKEIKKKKHASTCSD